MKLVWIFLAFCVGIWVGMEFNIPKETINFQPIEIPVNAIKEPVIPTKNSSTMTITWITDPIEVRKAVDEYNAEHPDRNMAIAISSYAENNCIIYSFEPKFEDDRDMTILGHEALHCFKGNFHK